MELVVEVRHDDALFGKFGLIGTGGGQNAMFAAYVIHVELEWLDAFNQAIANNPEYELVLAVKHGEQNMYIVRETLKFPPKDLRRLQQKAASRLAAHCSKAT